MSELPEITKRIHSLKATLEGQKEKVIAQQAYVDELVIELDKARFDLQLLESTANNTFGHLQAVYQQLQGFSAFEASKVKPVGQLLAQVEQARMQQQQQVAPQPPAATPERGEADE